MTEQFTSIDAYIASFPIDVQTILEEVRRRLHSVAPTSVEAIRYNIPTLTLDGRSLVHFAGWKSHVSVYPAPTSSDPQFEKEIAAYRGGKGTLRFPLSEPIRYDLIERVAHLLLTQLDERGS